MKTKRFFAVAMAVAMLFISVVPVQATQATRQRYNEARQRAAAGRTQVQGTQNMLQGLRSEMAALLATMQEYDQRIVDAIEVLDDIELALLSTLLRIEYAEADLVLAQEDLNLQNEALRARLRTMHESGPVGLLEVLFRSSSFSDFFMRMEAVRAVSEFDQNLLYNMRDAESRVAANIDTLTRAHVLTEELHAQEQEALEHLEYVQSQHQAWLAQLSENEEQVALLLEIQEAEQRALDEELGAARVTLRAEEAEIERRRREEEIARRNAALAEQMASLNFTGTFIWPVPGHANISSPFGPRRNPITRRNENHSGIDINAPTGTRINASADGVVRHSGWHGGYGLTIILDHGNGYSTLYAHNSRNLVSVGQSVTQGQHIANMGSTGQSTGPHVHFEIRRNGAAINPTPFVRR